MGDLCSALPLVSHYAHTGSVSYPSHAREQSTVVCQTANASHLSRNSGTCCDIYTKAANNIAGYISISKACFHSRSVSKANTGTKHNVAISKTYFPSLSSQPG